MRAARAWFVSHFKPKNMADVTALAAPGTDANASFRQVVSYWEMVASFITAGVLEEELVFQNSRELLLVWLRMRPIAEEARAAFKDPNAWKNLQTVGEAYMRYLGPETSDAFASRVAG
jgi:hypothetical protein